MRLAKDAMRHACGIMHDVGEYITFRKPAEFGSGFVGPFNYNWQALSPIDAAGLGAIVNDPYAYRFGFWLRTVSTVPDWARQSTVSYELLADMLDQDAIFGMLPDKTLSAFRRVSGREPDWRRKNAAECDVTYAVLRAVCDVVT